MKCENCGTDFSGILHIKGLCMNCYVLSTIGEIAEKRRNNEDKFNEIDEDLEVIMNE